MIGVQNKIGTYCYILIGKYTCMLLKITNSQMQSLGICIYLRINKCYDSLEHIT